MKKNIHDFIAGRRTSRFADVDFHDFIEMNEKGLSNEEISNELGIPKDYVNKLRNDLQKDY
ncbi:hypothetical protein [Sporosalibacterium faouarense]|uniref:hypothetical protein n=1 Tax=Sporosalibacterium faouarense TaxID=516123 RepID=UPI00141C1517|nr:hypothetical protein [Sporosalibacterium faouarense]MTI47780.1 hypothetical protein [Bacillota bacterium]